MIRVDVLDVERAVTNALPWFGMNNLMRDAAASGKSRINAGAVRAQHRFAINERQQDVLNMRRIES